jgi:hypothetical protein
VRLPLVRHPATPCDAVTAIEVEVRRAGSALALTYRLAGDAAALVIPPPAPPIRTDGLWRTTCFEAFVRPQGGEGYVEFNLAPSGAWAAYRFEAYRAGMAPLETAAPQIAFSRTDAGCELATRLALPGAGPARLALSAVIEEQGGRTSYWALAHAGDRPDFHAFAGVPLPLEGRG